MYVVVGYPILMPAVNDKTRWGSEGSDECRELDFEGNRRSNGQPLLRNEGWWGQPASEHINATIYLHI
jgi:hypothetical protein